MNRVKKGCNLYHKLLRRKANLNTNLSQREIKWHTELNCTYGIEFWNKTYNLTSTIKNDNRLKYLQFQINRNSLFTNYRVNKFKNNISPFCTFCSETNDMNLSLELISHLFYDCVISLNLWIEIKNWLRDQDIDIPLNRKTILFGIHEQKIDSVSNFIILSVKYFIWKSKFKSQTLFLRPFQQFLFLKLDDLKNAYLYEEKDQKFEPWAKVYENLSMIE